MAKRKNLFLCLDVLTAGFLQHLPAGSSSDRLCPECEGSSVIFPDTGRVQVLQGEQVVADGPFCSSNCLLQSGLVMLNQTGRDEQSMDSLKTSENIFL